MALIGMLATMAGVSSTHASAAPTPIPRVVAVPVPAGISIGSVNNATIRHLPEPQQGNLFQAMAGYGVEWLRLDVPFSGQIDEQGNHWWYVDGMIDHAVSRGIQIDALLGSPPAWARNADGLPNIEKFVAYVEAAVTRYSARGVHTYEIMNEVNLAFYWGGGAAVNPQYYAAILHAVYPAIKAIDPQATVITAGLAPAATTADGTRMAPMQYLTELYAAGAQGSFDAVAHHPYSYPSVPTGGEGWNSWTYMPAMHDLMAAYGDGAKKIWFTEFGAPTTGQDAVSETLNATMISEAFTMAAEWEWAGPLFLFQWMDDPNLAFGLHREDGSPKQAVSALLEATAPGAGESPPPAPGPIAPPFVAPGGVVELKVAGVGGVPADASAVVLNLTATNPAAAGYLTIFPCGQTAPNASNVNYTAGQSVPNLTITKVGTDGKVCITSLAATDIIADLAGWYPAGADYVPVQPTRVLDTRSGATVAPGGVVELKVAGVGGVPADASAVVLNLTATNPAAAGYLTIFPCGQTAPNASNVNYTAGQSVPNLTITKVGADGKVCITSLAATDIIADLAGWYPAGADYTPVTPTRVLDTRASATVAPGGGVELKVAGVGGVPADASAVVLNLTATNPAAAGYLTIFPCGQTAPNASNVNYTAGQSVPNLTITKVGTDGKVCITSLAATDIIADLAGWYPAGADYVPVQPTRVLDTRS